MVIPPKVAEREARKKYVELLREKEFIEACIKEIDEKLRSHFPTIELIDDIKRAFYEKRVEELDQEITSLLKEREKLLRQLEEVNQKLSELESAESEWSRISRGLKRPLKWGKILVGIFSVIIAARVFTTADLYNQAFGIIPGILTLFNVNPHGELAQRIVLLFDFILIESVIALFIYFVARAIFLVFDLFFNIINKDKLQIFFYVLIASASLSLVFITFFVLTVNY